MPRKVKKTTSQLSDYVIPSKNEDLQTFIQTNKIDMMERALSSIEYAILHNIPIVEVFKFKNSNFIVTISFKEFEANLDHIYQVYLDNEIYELCPRVLRIKKLLKQRTLSDEDKKESKAGSN